MRNQTNITRRESRAREIIVTFLETSPALFARRLINFSQILKLVSPYPSKSLKYNIWFPEKNLRISGQNILEARFSSSILDIKTRICYDSDIPICLFKAPN